MMTREDRQEALSLAYIKAVAAVCGMTYSVPSRDYGIDLTIHQIRQRKGHFADTGSRLDVQAKSTTRAAERDGSLSYDLTVKAYDDLREDINQEQILAVLVLPPDEDRWLKQTRRKLEIAGCVYWAWLRGFPAVANTATVRVTIPRSQVFSPAALRDIMDRIRHRRPLT